MANPDDYPALTDRQLDYRRRRELPLPELTAAPGTDPAEMVQRWLELDEAFTRARIGERERACLILRHYYRFTEEEMARLFGVSRSTVVRCLLAAQRKLEQSQPKEE
jgi:DNA-directed RNA polymerase specialized sigma24 family protein